MNYIHEFIKKNLNGIKKISWEKMSFIYDNMIISMKNILLEKSAIFDKIKKISIIAKNLYFILKNVFGIENDEYRD